MGEEVRITDYDVTGGGRVTEWEAGLPNAADLPPLSQFLISPELASAFSITPEPHRSMIDVDRASRDTLWTLGRQSQPHVMNKINDFKSVSDDREEEIVLEGEETVDLTRDGSPLRKLQRVDSSGAGDGGGEEADSARTSKRIRLVWTPQLHKRFVEVVAHLGVKNAVPKTITQLMNVEGLTRENVASHLQKYRLYLKRMQGLSNEGPSLSDHLFASTPVPKSLRDSGGASGNEIGHGRVPIPMPYPPQMVPVPYPPQPQIVPGSAGGGGRAYYNGFEHRSHPYNMMMQPKDWSGNNIGSVSHYPHQMTHNQK
ncbi:transcription factor PCL1-like isoform X2 [Bidens hawaiensis]|uniref:transcription factor PCL1-like isoform X2 n=1 Tax=Bidens hawaiensis TaxID=980011 RepID=UPI004049260D